MTRIHALAIRICSFILLCAIVNAQYVSLGNGSYRTTLIPTQGCGEAWEGPATTFDGGTPQMPLVTSNLDGVPIPTNDWWTSLLWPTGNPVNTYSAPLIAYPIVAQAASNGLVIGRQNSATAFEGRVGFERDLVVGLSGMNAPDTKAHDFSDFSVTADWNDGELRATIGHGMSYVYFERSTSTNARVLTIGNTTVLSNSDHVMLLKIDGGYYGLFGPTGSTWNLNGSTITNTLNAQDYFSVALLPATNDAEAISQMTDFADHAFNFVTDTRVSWNYDENSAFMTSTFDYKIEQKEVSSATDTFIAMLPHQWRYSPTFTTGQQYDAAYGPMEVVKGTEFQTVYKFNGILPTLPRVAEPASGFNEGTLRNYLQELANFNPPLLDTYFGGKDLNKLMQAAMIADQYGETELVDLHVGRVQGVLEDWFTTDSVEEQVVARCGRVRALYYDGIWGTIIGFPASFGSGTYLNDHHFHYGYWINAAAHVARFDPEWATLSNWGGMVELMIRDAAAGRDDPLFPFLRNYDPYSGHGWAGGPGDFASGNNQESSSESINCWAGMVLWGMETDNVEIRDRGIFMYATEIAAIEEYWFDVHDEIFDRIDYDQEVIGIKFGDGVAYATFFSGEDEAILGIQNIPVTASHLYWGRYPDDVIRIFDGMVANNGSTNFDLFQDLMWGYLGAADPDRALGLLNTANASAYNVEGGESRARTYHWLHGLSFLGNLETQYNADIPSYGVFNDEDVLTYAAYNASDNLQTVNFSDGTSFRVPPRELIAARAPISVVVTTPSQGEVVIVDEPFTIEAIADHIKGMTVTRVEFFVNGVSVGLDTAEPFSATWTPESEGVFEITAQAFDGVSVPVETQDVRVIADIGQLPFNGTPVTIVADGTTRIEAENFDVGDPGEAYFDVTPNNEGNQYRTSEQVDIEITTDTGGGFNVGFMAAGEFMEYTVDVEEAGLYRLDMRVAALDAGPAYRMEIDGVDLSGRIDVPDTNGFQNWTTVEAPMAVPLDSGRVILRIDTLTGLGNINWFELTGPDRTMVSNRWMLY